MQVLFVSSRDKIVIFGAGDGGGGGGSYLRGIQFPRLFELKPTLTALFSSLTAVVKIPAGVVVGFQIFA
jgi:hypothetical protein